MKKFFAAAAVFAALALGTASAAYAEGWQQSASGYWYGTNADNSTWYADGWQWIDGDGDGTAECYYFGADGILCTDGVTPDGSTVNAGGAWVQDGVVQTRSSADAAKAPAQAQESTQGNGAARAQEAQTEVSASAAASAGAAGSESSVAGTYVLNLNSKKFHYPDCKSVKRMKESNKKIVNESREQIISKGYEPCQNCNP